MKNIFKPKVIGNNYLFRWHLIPRNRFFNIYLHKFTGSDDARALHDHPWHSFSIKLRGGMTEIYKPAGGYSWERRSRPMKRFCFRPANFAHRLIHHGDKDTWTIFFTGRVRREWGFHCPLEWKHWTTMVKDTGETIGGCN